GIYTRNRDSVLPFYQDKLGFDRGRDVPGTRRDYIETPGSDRNLETKFPPLDPNNPSTRAQYDREVMGAVQHIGLEVVDMRAVRDTVQERGGYTDLQVRAHVGNNRHWLMHLFDGATLKGWDGPTDLWHVENGTIVVRSKADPPTGPTYLLWEAGEPKDFEFKGELKLEGAGANSGVQFRAVKLGEVPGNPRSKWETRGYQADLDNANANTGALIECCAGPRRGVPPRPDRAFRGQVVRTAVGEGQQPSLLAAIGDPDALKALRTVRHWN